MMVPSTAAAREIPQGLGQAITQANFEALTGQASSCRPEDGCFPDWCRWAPFADFADACKVPTAAAQAAAVKTQIEKAAGAGTETYNAELASTQYAAFLADQAAYCAAHPTECAEYTAAGEHPTCSAVLGASSLAQSFCKNQGTYLLFGVLGAVGIMMLAGKRS